MIEVRENKNIFIMSLYQKRSTSCHILWTNRFQHPKFECYNNRSIKVSIDEKLLQRSDINVTNFAT